MRGACGVPQCRGGGILIKPDNACVREKSPSGQAQGWELLLRASILCANVGPRSRHPQLQSSPCLLAMSPGAHALARRARSHCSFSTVLHVAASSTEERHFKKAAACSSHAGDAAACFSPHSHRCPHSVACFLRVLASQVFMLCKCVSRAYISHGGKPARVASSSTTLYDVRGKTSLCTLCVFARAVYMAVVCSHL